MERKFLLFLFLLFIFFFWINKEFISKALRTLHSFELKNLKKLVKEIRETENYWVLAIFIFLFLLLQSFAIPGAAPMTIIGGALFGSFFTTCLVSVLHGVGSTLCYLFSKYAGELIFKNLQNHKNFSFIRDKVEENRHNLFKWIFLARLTPVFPGWLFNLASPHLRIDIKVFFCSAIFGSAPVSFIYASVGDYLEKFGGEDNVTIFTPKSIACLIIIAIAVFKYFK
jgi:uncharacterized membrane protein YdjX (TVP38/TMEM64 family)